MKIIRVISVILLFPLLLLTVELRPGANVPKARAAEVSGVFKISALKSTTAQPGCPGCPEMETLLPQYEAVTGSSLVGALEIDTNRQSSWSNGVSTTIDGGCAITSSRGLKCWGDNKYGQLGNGTTTASASPVDAVGVSNVTDVAAGATRTCVVASGSIKCTGNFWWPGLVVKKSYIGTNTDTIGVDGNSSGNVWAYSEWACEVVFNGASVAANTFTSESAFNNGAGCNYVGWRSLEDLGQPIADAAEVFIYGDSEGWQSDTPTICYRSTQGLLRCATFASATSVNTNPPYAARYDCVGPSTDDFESSSESGCTRPYKRRTGSGYLTTMTAPIEIRWETADISNIVDVDVSTSNYGGLGTICAATGTSARCTTYNPTASYGSRFGTISEIQGVTAAEKVFITSYGYSGLCVYGGGLLSCGNGTWSNGVYTFPTDVTATGFMESPLALIFRELSVSGSSYQKLFIVTGTGILTTDPWAFNVCVNCYSQNSNSLSPVTAFKAATTDTYYVATGIFGVTDSIDLIPLRYETGSRDALSSKGITIKTAGGSPISGAKVTWTAPDIPGTLRSSTTLTNNTTNESGFVRFYGLRSGPITLTISGGSSGGSYLQAAVITLTLRTDESAVATVPDPGAVVDRTIRVQLPDKTTSVPNAVITLRNNYLQYSYANSGLASSTWSARAPEANLFNTVTCIYCYVPPPVYITGADGSVTFPSYVPTNRSSTYDLGISYDDSVITQSLLCRVTPSPCLISQVDQTFTLGFMATVQVQITDQDTSTPNQVDVVPSADGVVTVPLEMGDRDGPLDNSPVEAEDVCGTLLNGGLWNGSNSRSMATSVPTPGVPGASSTTSGCAMSVIGTTTTVSNCPGGVLSCSPTPGVSPAAVGAKHSVVRSFAACSKSTKATTDSKGKATLTLCPTQSGFFRIRGTGAMPSREICVKVKDVACSRTAGMATNLPSGGSPAGPTYLTPTTTTPPASGSNSYSFTGLGSSSSVKPLVIKRGKRTSTSLVLSRFPRSVFGGAVTVTAVGSCKIVGKVIIAGAKPGSCRVTVAQAAKGRSKATKKTYTLKIT